MFSETKEGIAISIAPRFLKKRSNPAENHYVWAYRVKIENNRDDLVRLKTRQWKIIDTRGLVHEVVGSGVVGETPALEPGESFEYTSGVFLATPSGMMQGGYKFETGQAQMVEVSAPTFSLDSPFEDAVLH